jgi:hypothetical protein
MRNRATITEHVACQTARATNLAESEDFLTTLDKLPRLKQSI